MVKRRRGTKQDEDKPDEEAELWPTHAVNELVERMGQAKFVADDLALLDVTEENIAAFKALMRKQNLDPDRPEDVRTAMSMLAAKLERYGPKPS